MNKPSCSGAQYLVARATSQYLPRPAVIAYGLHKHMSHDITHKIFSQHRTVNGASEFRETRPAKRVTF